MCRDSTLKTGCDVVALSQLVRLVADRVRVGVSDLDEDQIVEGYG
jgi:hypothetical protein